jgi:hypothetical protein
MDDGVDTMLHDRPVEDVDGLVTGQIQADQRHVTDPVGVTATEVIQHHDVITTKRQQPDDVAADVTGSAGDENGHTRSRQFTLALVDAGRVCWSPL